MVRTAIFARPFGGVNFSCGIANILAEVPERSGAGKLDTPLTLQRNLKNKPLIVSWLTC